MNHEAADPLLNWISVPSFGFPKLSPRRERVGFFWDPEGRLELFVVEVGGGPPVQVSHGELPKSPNASFVWDPEDASIVFAKDREGNELHDLYLINRGNGAVTRLTNDPTSQRYPVSFSPDGAWVLFASDCTLLGEERQLDLWRLPSKGGPAERVARHRQPVNVGVSRNLFSPDGSHIAYAASDQDDPRDAEVFMIRPGGASPERLFSARKGSKDVPVLWSPDGHSVAIESDAGDFGRAGILNVATREVRWLGPGTSDETPVDFSPDGRRLLAVRSRGVSVQPVVYELDSGEGKLLSPHLDWFAEAGFMADGRRILAVRNESNCPNAISIWGPTGVEAVDVLPPNFGPISPSLVVASSIVEYRSFDGRPIEAILYRPKVGATSGPAPALIEVHGGPTGQFFDGFDGLTQYLVSRGFAVLKPNVRGSTGYGSQFRDLNRFDLGGGDLKDVVAASEYLRAQSFVDPKRLGIFGGSYGGYLTYAALTWYPDLWAAGVAIAGVTDWKLCYEEELPALQHYDRQFFGEPGEHPQLWHDRSPVFFAERVRAPLMMIHGLHDPRCPVSQARVFRDALVRVGRKEGRDFEYLEFPDEGHGSADREQALRAFRPAFAFLERHLVARRA